MRDEAEMAPESTTFDMGGKLVRDHLLEEYRRGGFTNIEHEVVLEDPERYKKLLYQKLEEERAEFVHAPLDRKLSELADAFEVVDCLIGLDIEEQEGNQLQEEMAGYLANLEVPEEIVRQLQKAKRAKVGSFLHGIAIQRLSIPASSAWHEYFLQNYPVIE